MGQFSSDEGKIEPLTFRVASSYWSEQLGSLAQMINNLLKRLPICGGLLAPRAFVPFPSGAVRKGIRDIE